MSIPSWGTCVACHIPLSPSLHFLSLYTVSFCIKAYWQKKIFKNRMLAHISESQSSAYAWHQWLKSSTADYLPMALILIYRSAVIWCALFTLRFPDRIEMGSHYTVCILTARPTQQLTSQFFLCLSFSNSCYSCCINYTMCHFHCVIGLSTGKPCSV